MTPAASAISQGFSARWRKAALLGAMLQIGVGGTAWAKDATSDADPDAGAEADAQGNRAGDIVVTAQHRDTQLLKTPIAINAITSKQLEDSAVRRLNDLAGMAAGVTMPNQTLANQAIFIRGVGTAIASANPSVGVYIDDVYIPRPYGIGWYGSLPDVDQIEILHGPQGTLYGQSSSAGALKINSRTPDDHTKGLAELGIGNDNSREARGYISGAIVPGTLAASLAGAYIHRGGPDYNATLGRKVGKIDNLQLRGIVSYKPTSNFDAKLSVDYMRDRGEYRTAAPTTKPDGSPNSLRTTYSDIDPSQPYSGLGATLRLEYRPSDTVTLRSITAARGFDTTTPVDSDGLPTYKSGFIRDVNQRQISQEFQVLASLGRLDLTAGLSLYRERLNTDRWSWTNNAFSYIRSRNVAENAGAFVQADYKLTDKLTATAGVRLSIERREMDSGAWKSDAERDILANTYLLNGLHTTYRAALPKAALAYQWNPNLMSYVSFSIGQTTGGYNQAAPTGAVAAIPVDPEKVLAYEFGNKATFLGGKAYATATFYYNDYRDYQASLANPVLNGQVTAGTVVVNAGKATIYGGEFELGGQPLPRVDAHLSIAAMHSRFDSFENPTGAANTDYVGQALPFAPKFTLGASGTYTLPFASGASARFNGTVHHESSSFSEITTSRNLTKFPIQTYVDASIAVVSPGGHWTYSVTAKNLLGTNYRLPVAGAYSPSSGIYGFISNYPRQVMFRVRRDF